MLKQSTKVDVGLLGSWVSAGPMIWVDHVAGRYRLTLGDIVRRLPRLRSDPAVGQWQHVAATYDGTTARIYIDGVQTASTTFTGNVGDSNTWRIGAYGSPAGGFFDGLVDNVRVYDRALSPSEIQLDMVSRIQPETHPADGHREDPGGRRDGSQRRHVRDRDLQRADDGELGHDLDVPAQGRVGRVRRRRTVTYNASTNDRDADADRRAPVRRDVHPDGQGREQRRQGSGREPARRRRRLVVLDRGVAAADPRRRLDGEPVRDVPDRDPPQRGSERVHDDRRRVPLAGAPEPVRRRGARRDRVERGAGVDVDRLGQRRRQPDRDAARTSSSPACSG